MDITQENVIMIIKKIKDLPEVDLSDPKLSLRDDLALDSIDQVSALFEMENAFGFEIPQDLAVPETMGSLVEELNKLKK